MSSIMERGRTFPAGIFVACFLFALQDSAAMIALPWRILSLGGGSLAVGAVGVLSLGVYMVACLWTGSKLDRFGAKRLAMMSTFVTGLILLLMLHTTNVALLLALVGVKGMMMSAYWPPITGWVATGMEGPQLNRRLSLFNFSWSCGCIFGGWVGGILFAWIHWLPFLMAAGASLIGFLAIARVTEQPNPAPENPIPPDNGVDTDELRRFRWIARVGFVTAWIGLGALRVPIAGLIKQMGQDSGLHATITAGQNILMVVCFLLLGRWVFWHYRFSIIILGQLFLACMLGGVGASQSPNQLMGFAVLAMPILTLAYASHLFYCVSGGKHRRRNAALHEIILSLGFSIGSFGGGALAQVAGLRIIYFAAAGTLIGAVFLETGIFLFYPRRSLLPRPPDRKNPVGDLLAQNN